MAVETELPRKLIFLMGGKAIQTKLERETYVMTNPTCYVLKCLFIAGFEIYL